MDDTSIIELYWNRDEQAISETDKKYGKLCYRLADNILKRREDSEECVNDTFLKVWNSIPDDRPEHFTAYICQIAKRLALSKFRHNTAEKRQCDQYLSYDELSEFVSGTENPEEASIMAELSNSISDYLSSESKQNRIIFIRRYWYYDSISEISARYGYSEGKVKMILMRTRDKLRARLSEEDIWI